MAVCGSGCSHTILFFVCVCQCARIHIPRLDANVTPTQLWMFFFYWPVVGTLYVVRSRERQGNCKWGKHGENLLIKRGCYCAVSRKSGRKHSWAVMDPRSWDYGHEMLMVRFRVRAVMFWRAPRRITLANAAVYRAVSPEILLADPSSRSIHLTPVALRNSLILSVRFPWVRNYIDSLIKVQGS